MRASVVVLSVLGGLAAAPAAPRPEGTYRLVGTARIVASPILDREVDLHADAIVEPAGGPGAVRVRLAAEGHACALVARIEGDGALVLAPGQRCTVDVRTPELRGRVEARLRSGRGRLRDGRLALELLADLAGGLGVRAGGGQVLGAELPAAWTPEVPIRGEARARAEGRRDASRAPGR